MTAPVLTARGLTVRFLTRQGLVTAVDGIDLDLAERETLALVGESGCGKSATALALLGLHPPVPDAEVTGSARIGGSEVVGLDVHGWRSIRGRRIAMIFQEPLTALNPVLSIADQIVEAVRAHEAVGRAEARARAVALLEEVAIPDARRRVDDYPHQLSGGMRQRALIAIAIACRPQMLVADEPTTALDVTIQAQILELLRRLKDERGMALMLITHDLGVVADMADRVAVLYAGRKVEEAPTRALFARPAHPYTRGLLATRRRTGKVEGRRPRLAEIAGMVPALHELPPGCAFAPRCPVAVATCWAQRPEPSLIAASTPGQHIVSCHRAAEIAAEASHSSPPPCGEGSGWR